MISVDTNVIVRLLTKDEQAQFEKAKALFKKNKIFIPTTVILETEWVLRYAYHFQPSEISIAFVSLFGLSNVQVEEPNVLAEAIKWHQNGLDFADALHMSKSRKCQLFATFDKQFIKIASKITDFPITEP